MDENIRRMTERLRYQQSPQGQKDRFEEQRRLDSTNAARERRHARDIADATSKRISQLEEFYKPVIQAAGEFYAWCVYFNVSPTPEARPRTSFWRRILKADHQTNGWTLFERWLDSSEIVERYDPEIGATKHVVGKPVNAQLSLGVDGTLSTSRGKVLAFQRPDPLKGRETPPYTIYNLELLRYEYTQAHTTNVLEAYSHTTELRPENYFKGSQPGISGIPYNIARVAASTPYEWWS